MFSLSLKNIIIGLLILFIIYLMFFKKEKNVINNLEEPEILPDQIYQPETMTQISTFWSNIIKVENESSNLYQFQLPEYFNINPKYLLYHPNFTVSNNKMVQIISDNEEEAIAMLHLWIALNKGLLDKENNFSKLFETSIRRAKTYPSVAHKFKSEINNMIFFNPDETQPDNLEFTEDLALNEVLLKNPPSEEIANQDFETLNSFNDSNLASI